MTTIQSNDEAQPERIEVAPDIHAQRLHRHYALSFPFDPEASKRVGLWKTAIWDPHRKRWMMDAHRPDLVRKALEEILRLRNARQLQEEGGSRAWQGDPERLAVDLDRGVAVGDILKTKTGKIKVERLGAPFLSRFGRTPKMVRYAYGHSLSEAEPITPCARDGELDPTP